MAEHTPPWFAPIAAAAEVSINRRAIVGGKVKGDCEGDQEQRPHETNQEDGNTAFCGTSSTIVSVGAEMSNTADHALLPTLRRQFPPVPRLAGSVGGSTDDPAAGGDCGEIVKTNVNPCSTSIEGNNNDGDDNKGDEKEEGYSTSRWSGAGRDGLYSEDTARASTTDAGRRTKKRTVSRGRFVYRGESAMVVARADPGVGRNSTLRHRFPPLAGTKAKQQKGRKPKDRAPSTTLLGRHHDKESRSPSDTRTRVGRAVGVDSRRAPCKKSQSEGKSERGWSELGVLRETGQIRDAGHTQGTRKRGDATRSRGAMTPSQSMSTRDGSRSSGDKKLAQSSPTFTVGAGWAEQDGGSRWGGHGKAEGNMGERNAEDGEIDGVQVGGKAGGGGDRDGEILCAGGDVGDMHSDHSSRDVWLPLSTYRSDRYGCM